MLEKNIQIFT